MNTRLRRLGHALLIGYRRARYQRHFTACGANFEPLGKLVIRNDGTLIAGEGLTIRSFAYHPVQIDVGQNARLTLGDDVFLNQGVRIGCSLQIVIHDHVLIGDETLILDNDWHGVGNNPQQSASVIIESNVWIAARAMILRGVTLGQGCVVAAGAVVTHSVEPYTLVGGIPARPIRTIER